MIEALSIGLSFLVLTFISLCLGKDRSCELFPKLEKWYSDLLLILAIMLLLLGLYWGWLVSFVGWSRMLDFTTSNYPQDYRVLLD